MYALVEIISGRVVAWYLSADSAIAGKWKKLNPRAYRIEYFNQPSKKDVRSNIGADL